MRGCPRATEQILVDETGAEPRGSGVHGCTVRLLLGRAKFGGHGCHRRRRGARRLCGHQQSRKNYCEIGQELIASGFDYFAGGGLLNPTGASDNRIDLYEAARDAGYEVARTYDEGAAQVAEAETGSLMLTACEDEQLREAYERAVAVGAGDQEDMTQEEYVHYGTYEPFTVTLTHLLNRKSGVDFSTCAHSGLTVPVFALGAGAEVFDGFYDNTEIYAKLAALTGVA